MEMRPNNDSLKSLINGKPHRPKFSKTILQKWIPVCAVRQFAIDRQLVTFNKTRLKMWNNSLDLNYFIQHQHPSIG